MTTTKYPIRRFAYAIITNVVDGDTVDILLDLGFTVKVKTRFRLARINTPERGEPGWQQATDYMRQFVDQNITLDSTKIDKYGRYLADIYVGDTCINDYMLQQGLAKPYI